VRAASVAERRALGDGPVELGDGPVELGDGPVELGDGPVELCGGATWGWGCSRSVGVLWVRLFACRVSAAVTVRQDRQLTSREFRRGKR
jgi:hypothetical protein